MGNHGGGIPKGAKNRKGTKGTSANSTDSGKGHSFHVGDHVRVNTGLKGTIKRKLGLNHVHVVPKTGRAVIAHVRNVTHVGVSAKVKGVRVGVHT